ncbi:SAV0927 family protein [Brevibacillus ginsengisoli]|uniref:SAV0927 family protein n=1 Tax=Brevibacillus ginsengisoli TaxID=363854 RepID=UPI003CF390E1
MEFDYLYDEIERPFTRFVSYVAKKKRYDFVLMYTQHFEGKCMVMSLQTMRMVMLSSDDIPLGETWVKQLDIAEEDREIVTDFFRIALSGSQKGFVQY